MKRDLFLQAPLLAPPLTQHETIIHRAVYFQPE